ncbi:AarF/ABC1/UbiB kinase family protein [Streptomyces sp. MW-W600-10]|uniref:ABC1 kinase family protein n=1 Tax=Streptomyces sp. MW-W600-10 TaxID=2829819 RepID=UPI001C43C309|nr:AarF/UbiB family protein [Streptomyces sp. MW-W600-10]MBV7245422.1 AarF/ABC1/UbiB kinase family protein [Streptomyces sp. MW-W600-10]
MNDLVFALAGTVGVVTLAIGMAVGARRLLGLRVGTLRMVLASLVGFATAVVFGNHVQPPLERGALATVMVGISVLVTMAFLVLADVVMSDRSRPVAWTRRLHRRIMRVHRYAQIGVILARHGLAPFLRRKDRTGKDRGGAAGRLGSPRLARSLRLAIEEGGVTFVKLGQLMSTRPDAIPSEFTEELSKLQCKVAPAPWPEVRRVLEDELGGLVDSEFAEFDPEPLAAGSVAQVHRARLTSGTSVVIKIQRPGIHHIVERDLDIMGRIAVTLEERADWARSIGAVALAEGFATALREELDFQVELRNMSAIGAAAAEAGTAVCVPEQFHRLCTKRVLVLEHLEGTPIGEAGPRVEQSGLDREELAGVLLDCMMRQVMIHGVFHCDPHPGNILLLDDGRLALLDFGVVGRLDAKARSALRALLLAVKRGDRAALCDALLDLVIRHDDLDEQALERELGDFVSLFLTAGTTPDLEMFAGLFRVIAGHGLSVPPQVAGLFRMLATLHGTLMGLAPSFDIVTESRELVAGYYTERFQPAALRATAGENVLSMMAMLSKVPRRLDRITGALEEGRLGVTVRLGARERDRRLVTGLVHLSLITVLAAAFGIMGVLLLGTDSGPLITPTLGLLDVFGYNLLVVSSVLGLRVLVRVFRGEP